MAVTIRKMKIEDLPAVTELAAQLGYPESLEKIKSRFSKILGHSDIELLVAEENQKILGWIQANEEKLRLIESDRAEIGALVVDEKIRSQGIGRQLLGAAEDWARARGMKVMRLRSNVTRENAHRFYLREGYANSKTSKLFVKTLS